MSTSLIWSSVRRQKTCPSFSTSIICGPRRTSSRYCSSSSCTKATGNNSSATRKIQQQLLPLTLQSRPNDCFFLILAVNEEKSVFFGCFAESSSKTGNEASSLSLLLSFIFLLKVLEQWVVALGLSQRSPSLIKQGRGACQNSRK